MIESLEPRRLLSANLLADYDGIYPAKSVQLGGRAYFAANDGVRGNELWTSDGTPEGTSLAVEIYRGGGSSNPRGLAVLGDALIFLARGRDGRLGVWRSDGTSSGTVKLAGLPAGASFSDTAVHNGKVFFVSRDDNGADDLWVSDGTMAGTSIVRRLSDDLSQNNNPVFAPQFQAVGQRMTMLIGARLFSSDGTIDGTEELSTPRLAGDPARPAWVLQLPAMVDGGAMFVALRDPMLEIWKTDGTAEGTRLLASTDAGGSGQFVTSGGKAFFKVHRRASHTQELWASDGTVEGTGKVVGFTGSIHGLATMPDGRLLIGVWYRNVGYELYISDGTPQGTVLIEPTRPGDVDNSRVVGEMFFYSVYVPTDGVSELQLWCTSGVPGSAKFVDNLSAQVDPQRITAFEEIDGKLVIASSNKTLIYDPEKLSAPAGPAQGRTKLTDRVLRVFGTNGDDVIRIYQSADEPDRFVVNLNGVERTYAFADVRKLIVYGYSGDDAIAIDELNGVVAIRSRIAGGAGSDSLSGGSSRDTVLGEGGDDLIRGGRNDDLLAGGTGDDAIFASKGDDTATGNEGSDSVTGGLGDDLVSGGDDSSDDQLDGGGGIDVIFGHAVHEIFYSGKQAENLSGIDEVLLM
jgi:ELWxxDGT repeat protein